MSGTTTTVNPNVFFPSPRPIDLEAPKAHSGAVDLEEAQKPEGVIDLDGKLEEENFGQGVNESVSVEDVSTPLNSPSKAKKSTKK